MPYGSYRQGVRKIEESDLRHLKQPREWNRGGTDGWTGKRCNFGGHASSIQKGGALLGREMVMEKTKQFWTAALSSGF